MNMTERNDPSVHLAACLLTPGARLAGLTQEQAFVTEGACVKSYERDTTGFPARFGILVSYDEKADLVVVRSHADGFSPIAVWHGTVADYRADWQVD